MGAKDRLRNARWLGHHGRRGTHLTPKGGAAMELVLEVVDTVEIVPT